MKKLIMGDFVGAKFTVLAHGIWIREIRPEFAMILSTLSPYCEKLHNSIKNKIR